MSKPLSMRGVPSGERPRERLYHVGARELSLQEVIAIIVGGGAGGAGSLVLSLRLLDAFGDIAALARAGVDDLRRVSGIGFAKACQLVAAFEIGRRLARESLSNGSPVKAPGDVARVFMEEMKHFDREHFRATFLNTKNQIIKTVTVSIGSLNASIVHPREILKPAISASAASIILVHNHPTGDPSPSREDIEFTRRFAKCGELIGIELLDHVIVGAGRYQSLKEGGFF